MLLAIDPSMRSPGAALFNDNGYLVATTRIEIGLHLAELDDGQRWLEVARCIYEWAARQVPATRLRLDVVFEKPQFYQRKEGGSKGDPNKLAGVLAVACNLVGMLSMRYVVCVTAVEPAGWIGQISKHCPTCERARAARKGTKVKTFAKDCPDCHGSAWNTPRGRRIRYFLKPDEIALVPDQNDAIDAVGLGLWKRGRLVQPCNYSSS